VRIFCASQLERGSRVDAGLKNIAPKPRNADRRPAVLVDSVFLAVLAMLVGAIAAYAAIAFIFLIGVVQEFFY